MQAVLNAVLALSSLLQLPLKIRSEGPPDEENGAALVPGMLQSIGNPRQLAYDASSPYFDRAKDALKECFALPSLDTTSALLALSECSQIMDDVTSAFLYSNMALSMCDLAGDDIPEEVASSCAFLKQIRSHPQPISEIGMTHNSQARFLNIVGHIMAAARSQHCLKKPWPKREMEEDRKTCPFGKVFKLLDEAEVLVRSASLPTAAKLWCLALRGRIMCIMGDYDGAAPIFEEVARTAVEDPHTMQDPFSLYAIYSITFSLQHLTSKGGSFKNLWQLLRAMAMVWPLAETLLRYVNVGEVPMGVEQGNSTSTDGASSACSGSSNPCFAEVEKSSLGGMPPEKNTRCSKVMEAGVQPGVSPDAPSSNTMASSGESGIVSVAGDAGTTLVYPAPELVLDEELPHKAAHGSATSDEPNSPPSLAKSFSNELLLPFESVHGKEEYGVPLFTRAQEDMLDNLVQGIMENDELDLDALIGEIDVDVDFGALDA